MCGAVARTLQIAGTARCTASRMARLTSVCIGAVAALAASAGAPAWALEEPAKGTHMTALEDDELATVRGADGIAFNLNNYSLLSSATDPLSLTYLSPNGSSLTLSRLDLSRTDDADAFADPYQLSLVSRPGLSDMISLSFPLNTTGSQLWSLTADFANCDAVTAGVCTGTNFLGGTLQVQGLALRGGGLTIAPTTLADTQGIAFGFGTQIDIGSLAVYSRGRTAGDTTNTIDTSDALTVTGIHLADATTGGPWMLADLDKHPGLLNAQTDATGSYLHLQIGWPTTADPVPAAALRIDNISFTNTTAGVATTTNLGSASIASLQINYVDIKLRTGP